jgi:hypothetical protein
MHLISGQVRRMRYVQCLFCDERKQRSDFLCKSCRILYGPYEKEAWFSEFVQMERKQRRITKQESTNFEVDFLPKEPRPQWGSSKSRGRPRTTDLVESYIRSIYQDSFSIRKITSLCQESGLVVSRESVRTILNKIKSDK